MKKIPLTQGKFALVDDADFEWLNRWKWYFTHGYAARNLPRNKGKSKRVYMHIQIMNPPNGKEVDHRDLCRSNNQRENLRICTRMKNQRNGKLRKNNTSGYKGVTFNKRDRVWVSYLYIKRKQKVLGYFKDPIEAAKAYDKSAREFFGEFARVNFP